MTDVRSVNRQTNSETARNVSITHAMETTNDRCRHSGFRDVICRRLGGARRQGFSRSVAPGRLAAHAAGGPRGLGQRTRSPDGGAEGRRPGFRLAIARLDLARRCRDHRMADHPGHQRRTVRLARCRQIPDSRRQDHRGTSLQRYRAAARIPQRRNAGADHQILEALVASSSERVANTANCRVGHYTAITSAGIALIRQSQPACFSWIECKLIEFFVTGVSNVPHDPGEHKKRRHPREYRSDYHRLCCRHHRSLMSHTLYRHQRFKGLDLRNVRDAIAGASASLTRPVPCAPMIFPAPLPSRMPHERQVPASPDYFWSATDASEHL